MFISLSRAISKMCRFHIGFRITKSNFAWMSIIMLFVYLFVAMWYILVVSFWMVYAALYIIYQMFAAPCRAIYRGVKRHKARRNSTVRSAR